MWSLRDLLAEGQRVPAHRPWPRAVVGREGWQRALSLLAESRCTMLGLWGENETVHIALVDEEQREPGILSFECGGGSYPSVGRLHAPAIRLERALRDLSGL
jgi:hypothetical protein